MNPAARQGLRQGLRTSRPVVRTAAIAVLYSGVRSRTDLVPHPRGTMPRPETLEDVLALVRRHHLAEDDRLATFLTQLQAAGYDGHSPKDVLSLMAAQGLLTPFQA